MPIAVIYRTPANALESLTIDASIQETYAGDVSITSSPIEASAGKLATATDHVKKGPASMKFEGVLSDYPLSAGSWIPPTRGAGGPGPGDGRALTLYEQLEYLRDSGTLLEVWTGAKVFENMLLENLSFTRNKDGKLSAIKFTGSFREVQIVFSETVPELAPAIPKARGKVSKGKQNGTPASPKEVRKSILKAGTDKIVAMFGGDPAAPAAMKKARVK